MSRHLFKRTDQAMEVVDKRIAELNEKIPAMQQHAADFDREAEQYSEEYNDLLKTNPDSEKTKQAKLKLETTKKEGMKASDQVHLWKGQLEEEYIIKKRLSEKAEKEIEDAGYPVTKLQEDIKDHSVHLTKLDGQVGKLETDVHELKEGSQSVKKPEDASPKDPPINKPYESQQLSKNTEQIPVPSSNDPAPPNEPRDEAFVQRETPEAAGEGDKPAESSQPASDSDEGKEKAVPQPEPEPEASNPKASNPEARQLEPPQMEAPQPEASKSEASKPESPQPEASQPKATESETSKPEAPMTNLAEQNNQQLNEAGPNNSEPLPSKPEEADNHPAELKKTQQDAPKYLEIKSDAVPKTEEKEPAAEAKKEEQPVDAKDTPTAEKKGERNASGNGEDDSGNQRSPPPAPVQQNRAVFLEKTEKPSPEQEVRITQLETKHETLDNKVQQTDQKTDKHALDLTQVVSTQQTHGNRLDDHQQKIVEVKAQTDDHKSKLDVLIKNWNENDKDIAIHETHLVSQHEDLADLKKKMDTQLTKSVSCEAKIDHVSAKLKEVDQVKDGLHEIQGEIKAQNTNIDHHGRQINGLTDRTKALEKDMRRIEVHEERFNALQSNVHNGIQLVSTQDKKLSSMMERFNRIQSSMADCKGLITDVRTTQEHQKAQILTLKDKFGGDVVRVKEDVGGKKPNIELIAGLGAFGLAALAGGGAAVYFWWKKRKSSKTPGKGNDGDVQEGQAPTGTTASVNVDVTEGDSQGRRKSTPRLRAGRLHSREWNPDFSTLRTRSPY